MLNPFNVVLITMDAVRPDHLGAYGYDGISTPNIDEIAREGVLFEGATAASCLTPIAHGSILTGNNPPVHNMRDPFSHLKTPMISETLKEHGYATAGCCRGILERGSRVWQGLRPLQRTQRGTSLGIQELCF